VKCETIR